MRRDRTPRRRVALVDLQLGDCDRLTESLGERLQVSLVVAPTVRSPLARWAELGGYPWATDLEALTAVVADTVAVAAESPRRAEALALAGALGARWMLFGAAPGSGGSAETPAMPSPDRLDAALASLFDETPEDPLAVSEDWRPAQHAGFSCGALYLDPSQDDPPDRSYGPGESRELLSALAKEATRARNGWVALALAERGFWKAWCALAPRGDRGAAIALGGRLLPAQGYGEPTEESPPQRADRRLAAGLIRSLLSERPARARR